MSVWLSSPPKAETAGKRQGFASLVIVRKFKIDLLLFFGVYIEIPSFMTPVSPSLIAGIPSLMGTPVMGKSALGLGMAPVLMALGWGSWVGSRILDHLKLSHAIPASTLLISQGI